MKRIISSFLLPAIIPAILFAQANVGIGGAPNRARLEVYGIPGYGTCPVIFGSDGSGISFQQNWPTVGFNQYRLTYTGYGKYMGSGYAAVQYMDPSNGAMVLDMQSVIGSKDVEMGTELRRAFTIFNSGTVCFGKGYNNSNMIVDYLNVGGTNIANGSAYFYGTQYPSFINTSDQVGMPTQIGPGKDGGTSFINDVPGSKTVIGGSFSKLGINTNPLYLTTLSIRHATAGNGLGLIEETSYNNWEWYVSNDNPVWMGQKYNTLLVGDFNPITGQHDYISDRRLKTGIHPLSPVLDKVMGLQPVQYKMKNAGADAPTTQGFIAQEVKKLFPELVSVLLDNTPGNKGLHDLHMLNYSQFFVVAIKAIQEQQSEITELTKEISRLEQKN